MNTIEDIRNIFRAKQSAQDVVNGTLEIQFAQFECTDDRIFGVPNREYIKAEIEWYRSCSKNVYDLEELYGRQVAIWRSVADKKGYINSNYGWCIFSDHNGNQFSRVLETLRTYPVGRQAVMIYTNPFMHEQSTHNGRRDFMCTNTVQYFINDGKLDVGVYMRSNDAVFGYNNDYAWQKYVQQELCSCLGIQAGKIIWNAASLHVYDRHWHLVCSEE